MPVRREAILKKLIGLWKTLRSVDRCLISFFLALNGLILIFHQNLHLWPWHTVKHFMFCLVILIVAPIARYHGSRAVRFIFDWYPVASIPFIYWNMSHYIHLVFPGEFDALIISFETALFGKLPNIALQDIVAPVITEIMQLFYASYWFVIPVGAAILYFGRHDDLYDRFLYYVTLTFSISCIVFVLFPVAGPRFFIAHRIFADYQGLFATAFLRRFVEDAGMRGCAFPSAHVAVAVVVMTFVGEACSRWGRLIFLTIVTGLSLATIYGQYHYLTDVVAGLFLGMAIGWIGTKKAPGKNR